MSFLNAMWNFMCLHKLLEHLENFFFLLISCLKWISFSIFLTIYLFSKFSIYVSVAILQNEWMTKLSYKWNDLWSPQCRTHISRLQWDHLGPRLNFPSASTLHTAVWVDPVFGVAALPRPLLRVRRSVSTYCWWKAESRWKYCVDQTYHGGVGFGSHICMCINPTKIRDHNLILNQTCLEKLDKTFC